MMKINDLARNDVSLNPRVSEEMVSDQVSQDDMHWFNNQMQLTSTLDSVGILDSNGVLGSVAKVISNNKHAQKNALRDLAVASKSTSQEDFSRANAVLSDYYIESLMNVKLVSKGVQALDKIINLQ